MTEYTLRLEPAPDIGLRDEILAPLARYNEQQGGPSNYALLAITLRDEGGEVAGGLWARMAFGYTMNKQGRGVALNERGQGLVDATYRALGYRANESGRWV